MKKKLVRIASLLLVALLLCAQLCGCAEKPLTLDEQLELGMRYLSELNYENAVIAFTAVIEIDPKSAQGYAGLYSAYAAQGEMDLAEQTWAAMLEAGVSADEMYRWVGRMADVISQAGGDGEAIKAAADSMMPQPEPTPEPTPGPTAEPGPETGSEAGGSSVSVPENWQDKQFVLFDKLFTMPFTGEDLAQLGFSCFDVASSSDIVLYATVYPDLFGSDDPELWEHDYFEIDLRISASTFDLDAWTSQVGEWDRLPPVPADWCRISYMRVDGERASWLKLAGGIDFNSSEEDIIRAYGEPASISENGVGRTLNYESDDFSMTIEFFWGELANVYLFFPDAVA